MTPHRHSSSPLSALSPSPRSQSTPTTPPHHDTTDLYQWIGTNMTSSTSDLDQYSDDDFIIGFANVHGLRSQRTPLVVSLHDMTAAMTSARISVLGMSEHQISIKDPHIVAQTINQFARIRRQQHPTICQFNSSNETSAGTGRLMGGTAIMAIGDIIGRLIPNGSDGDSMGRWSYIHLKRHHI